MKSRRKIFWIFLFAAAVFCCWLYFVGKIEQTKPMQVTVGTKSQIEISSATATSAVPLPKLLSVESNSIFPVVRVIDGDTIIVSIRGTDETVRLLGMDTPETVDSRKHVQCFGPEASLETKSLLDGRSVTLQSDPTQSDRDKYYRLLRYVFRDDGLFIDEFLIKEGFAREYTYFGVAYKYQTVFRADQAAAQGAGLGLWASTTCNGKI